MYSQTFGQNNQTCIIYLLTLSSIPSKTSKLLSTSQSGFRSIELDVSHLLSTAHDIYADFYVYPTVETRVLFLEIITFLLKTGSNKVEGQVSYDLMKT